MTVKTSEEMWEKATVAARDELAKADRELPRLQSRIRRLRNAIKMFQENKATGFPWPGIEKQQDEGETP